MKLNVQERLTLVNLLPEKGSFVTMSVVESLKDILYPSEKEVKDFEIKQEGNILRWNDKGAEGTEISLSEMQKEILVKELDKLSTEESLDINQYKILKRFKTSDEKTE